MMRIIRFGVATSLMWTTCVFVGELRYLCEEPIAMCVVIARTRKARSKSTCASLYDQPLTQMTSAHRLSSCSNSRLSACSPLPMSALFSSPSSARSLRSSTAKLPPVV